MMHIYKNNVTTLVRNKANPFNANLKMAVLPTCPSDINTVFSDISKQNIYTSKFCQENGEQYVFTQPNLHKSMIWKGMGFLESKMAPFENAKVFRNILCSKISYIENLA